MTTKNYNFGFSVLEISILLIIISIVGISSISMGGAVLDTQRTIETKKRLMLIDKAIVSYFESYGELPCPADYTLDETDALFGISNKISPGVCGDIETSDADTTITELTTGIAAKGIVPTDTLNIPSTMAFDAWGRKIDYILEQDFNDQSSFHNPYKEGKMYVYPDYNDTAIPVTNDIVYVLMSHGKSGHGARLKKHSLGIKDIDSTNTKRDMYNANGITASKSAPSDYKFIPRFIDMPYNFSIFPYIAGHKKSIFDDILAYRNKKQINKKYSPELKENIFTFTRVSNSADANISGVFLMESSLSLIKMKTDGSNLLTVSTIEDVYNSLLNSNKSGKRNHTNILFCRKQISSAHTNKENFVCALNKDSVCTLSITGATASYVKCVNSFSSIGSFNTILERTYNSVSSPISMAKYPLICINSWNSC